MKNNQPMIFTEYLCILNFLSRCMARYSYSGNRLRDFEKIENSITFFSRLFLSEKNWSVIPLWGTNLKNLTTHEGLSINLTDRVKKYCTKSNVKFVYYSMIEEVDKLWYSDFPTFAISGNKIELTENLGDFYGIRGSGKNVMGPYMGSSMLWPADENFAIYSDGDNLAFIAGDLQKIEELIELKYDSCMKEFIEFNSTQLTIPDLYLGLANFCDENLKR